jgi:uncharacterized membrane protein YhhN
MDQHLVVGALIAVSALSACAYGLIYLTKPASLPRAAIKTLFMASLAVLVDLDPGPRLLLVAVVASACGDALLSFDKKWVLPLGILSFLIAQLCYLTLFLQLAHDAQHVLIPPAEPPDWFRYGAIALVAVVSIGFLIWLWPKLGALAFGVVPYSLAIAAMAGSAMLLPWIGWLAMLGAVLFFVSDGTLSAELFRLPPDAPARRITGPVVWWTYVAAQALIILGILRVNSLINPF